MPKYKVNLTQLCEPEHLDNDDIMEFGEHPAGTIVHSEHFEADTEKEALDQFHLEVPIACVDDYSWEATLV